MYYSIYRTERKQVSIEVFNEMETHVELRPLIKPNIRTDSDDVSVERDRQDPGRDLPPGLEPVSARTDNNGVVEAFYQMMENRAAPRTSKKRSNVSTYLVNYKNIMDKLSELIEMFDFFREYDRYSQMTFRLRKIMEKCGEDLRNKLSSYNKIIDIRDAINSWHKQSQPILDGMKKINDVTVRDKINEEYTRDLDRFYTDGISELIGNLPLARVSRELELAKGVTSAINLLMEPLLKSQNCIQCPVCLDSKAVDMHVVPCGHIVCKECLDHLQQATSNLSCPNCRKQFQKSNAIKLFLSIGGIELAN
jgi:hypothetical protein